MRGRLDEESRRLLAKARIGMLALNAGRWPLVNPAAFHYGGDAVWITTSRHAVKAGLARKRGPASFLVDDGRSCVLLEGEADLFDALSLPNQVRAALEGPSFYLNLAGYAWKNAAYIGGYLRDIHRIPGDWWPQNRAVLRLRAERAWSLPAIPHPPAGSATLPGLPAGVRRSLAREPVGYLCTLADEVPLMAPALWAVDGDGLRVVTGVAGFLGIGRRGGPGGLAVEYHHRYRATRMAGAYLRGSLQVAADAKEAVKERYDLDVAPRGMGLRLLPERVTWWRGFEVKTARVEDEAEAARPTGA
jgi:pyridoxamine 5'-phosphate oxidase-like protein